MKQTINYYGLQKFYGHDYFCNDNCEWNTLKFKEAQRGSKKLKLERGSAYERNNVSETKKKTTCKLAKLETMKIQAINGKAL